MSESRPSIALLYDDRQRPETTGGYCLRALEPVAEVCHVLPDQLYRIATDRFDFILRIDDGQDYSLPEGLGRAAWWAIDTHLNLDWYASQARRYEHVFCAQKNGAEALKRAGVKASWLPLACDPTIHRRHDLPLEHEICFIGNLFPGPRVDLLERLRRRFPGMAVGQRYFDEMARTYSASKIAFNRSVRDDVNMRVFEALACGPLLLTNDLASNGQADLFQDGVHLATYRDGDELIEKARWYLANEDARAKVAAAGRKEVHAKHTYSHRMERIIEKMTVERPLVQSVAIDTTIKDPTYFDFARPELVRLIPESCRRVLDVGCGAGALGAELRRSRGAFVVGLERDPAAAAIAANRLDEVVAGDAEAFAFDPTAERFDAVVCGDVLEHLRHPDKLLRVLRDSLAADGVLVASLPNVRNRTVVGPLLRGNWTYESAGLLDEDHVRFFTRREMEKLFFRAGFDVERVEVVPGPGYREWKESGRFDQVRLGPITLKGLPVEEAEEFHVYQYLVVARPRPTSVYGVTSIVIPVHNQLALTRECLASIRQRTDEPYELIVVDNGSTDGTTEWLRTCKDVHVIRNEENRGFPAAVNQGIAAARGDFVLLLNNDTVVTTGWLRRMLEAFAQDPKLGLVGPCSNFVGSEQQVQVNYDELEDLDGFAWDHAAANHGRVEPTNRLVGFCLLARKEVINEIGVLDERFGTGNYEDDDWCRRAIGAGWKCGIVRDAFVHHYGHATFDGSGIDLRGLLNRNEKVYLEKWSGDRLATSANGRNGRAMPRFSFASSKNGLRLTRRILLSATLIVRNNENTIRACIESLLPWMDEIIVVDTGSTDRTPEICRELGAKVYFHTWPDSFADARNLALDYASGEWIFWMDSDDVLPEECGAKLRALLEGPVDSNVMGYFVQVHCPHVDENGDVGWTAVDHVKIFRNRAEFRWQFRIHENILPSIRAVGGQIVWTDLFVVHAGSDQTPEGKLRKLERDYRLLELELRDRPEHPFALFNLGMTHHDCGRYEEAVAVLQRARVAGDPGETQMRKVYVLLASSLQHLGRNRDSEVVCGEGLSLYPDDIELAFHAATLLEDRGLYQDAINAYSGLLKSRPQRYLASINPELQGLLCRLRLAEAFEKVLDLESAAEAWRTLVHEAPTYRAGWDGMLRFLCRYGEEEQTAQLHHEYLKKWPNDATAWHNLGAALSTLGRSAQALEAFERSLAIRPDYPPTLEQLEAARAAVRAGSIS